MTDIIDFTKGRVMIRSCPNCGWLASQEEAELSVIDFNCRGCGEHKLSEFQIEATSPDVRKGQDNGS